MFHASVCTAVALFAALSTQAGDVGHWTFGGRVGATQASGALRTEAALNAEYAIANRLSWRTDVSFLFLDASDEGKFDVTVPTNLLFWPAGRNAKFRPYLGPGANATYTHDGNATFGANLLGGIQVVNTNNTTFGIEGKYLFPDLGRSNTKGQLSLSMTGAFQIQK